MLILIVECEVLINVLRSVVWRRQAGDSCQLVRLSKGPLTLFEILKTDTFGVHRMPMELAASVVRVTVK